jgi:hypothetical protein
MPRTLKPNKLTGSELATGKSSSLPDKPITVPERIRAELNLEKWAIWKPAKSKTQPTERKLRREYALEEGKKIIAEVEVGYTNKGELTTEDQKVYYGLVKIWEDAGRPNEVTPFSLKLISKTLKRGWGSNVIESLTGSMLRLRVTPLIWTNSFEDGLAKKTIEVLDPFNILSTLKIIRTKADGHVTKLAGYFRFDDHIMKNLQANLTKPVLFEVIIGFKTDIAVLLYPHLDLVLFDKTFYKRRTKDLFNELGLDGKAYRNRSDRKRALEPALKDLEYVPLTSGRIASITLEETADGKDFNLVIRKGKLVALPKINHYRESSSNPVAQTMSDTPPSSREVDSRPQPEQPAHPVDHELDRQAKELVTHFYQVFHAGKRSHINYKSKGQAISLITQYGFEQSKYIVDFAHREAPKTNFDIQAFGGVIQYTSRALDEYERRKLAQEQIAKIRDEEALRTEQELEQLKQEEAVRERAKMIIEQMPVEEYQTLYNECAEQFKNSDFFKSHYQSQTIQAAIKGLMVKRIIERQESKLPGETISETTPQEA